MVSSFALHDTMESEKREVSPEIFAPPHKRVRRSQTPSVPPCDVDLPEVPVFETATFDKITQDSLKELTVRFSEKHPGLSRTILLSVPEMQLISDQFIVVQLVLSRGRATIGPDVMWRLQVTEILPDGTRDQQHLLTIKQFRPNIADEIPREMRDRLEYRDFTKAPVLFVTGFTRQRDSMINPMLKTNLLCDKASNPSILFASVRQGNGLFASDFPVANGHAAPADDALPAGNHGYGFPPGVNYKPLGSLVRGQRYHIMGVIRHFKAIKQATSGEWMQFVALIDPTTDLSADQKLHVCLFAKTRAQLLPTVTTSGDVLVLRNILIKEYQMENQGSGYSDTMRLALCPRNPDLADLAKQGSTYVIPPGEQEFIQNLHHWYDNNVRDIIFQHEKEYQEKKQKEDAKLQSAREPVVSSSDLPESSSELDEALLVPQKSVLVPITMKMRQRTPLAKPPEKDDVTPIDVLNPNGKTPSDTFSSSAGSNATPQDQKTWRSFCRIA